MESIRDVLIEVFVCVCCCLGLEDGLRVRVTAVNIPTPVNSVAVEESDQREGNEQREAPNDV